MQLVERYLQAVRFWLPKKQQDDIIAELSEDLHAQIEEREAELGRPLAGPELEDLLRRRGSPMRVANGYLPQHSLIGPVLFPIYVLVLKIVTALNLISLAVGLISGIIGRAAGNAPGTGWTPPFSNLIRGDWHGWVNGMIVVTIVFAVIERAPAKEKLFESWDPRKLPPLRPANAIPRSNSIWAVSGLACLLLWWVARMASPVSALRFGSLQVGLSVEWPFVFWTVLVLSLGSLALEITNLLRPWWTVSRAALKLVLDAVGTAVFCWAMQAHLVASVFWPGVAPERANYAVAQFNVWLARIFPWAIAVGMMIAAYDVWRITKIRSNAAQASGTQFVTPSSNWVYLPLGALQSPFNAESRCSAEIASHRSFVAISWMR